MKLTTLLLIVSILQVSAASFAQKITLSEKNAPITKVFNKIKSQTGYDFIFTGSLLKNIKPVTITVKNADLKDVLEKLLDGQQLDYSIEDKSVVISKKAPSFPYKLVDAFAPPIDVSGVVLDEKGAPLVGATVRVKGVSQSTTTDAQGRFSLPNVDDKAILVITFIGYTQKEIAAKATLSISLEVQPSELQEVVVAYGKQSQQSLTGAVTVVSGKDIEAMPNRSFDRSLQGLVPGLLVSNGTGQPGGGVSNFVLRGISTAADASAGSTVRNPLIVIDGVPVSQDNFQLYSDSRRTMIANPLAQLNPSDIESLTVLKDASAIALYGARASSGVIVVTTKKGKSGKSVFTFRTQTDFANRISGNVKTLNKDQYLELLFETYRNSDPIGNATNQAIIDKLTKPQGNTPALIPTRSDGSFYPGTDWLSTIYKDRALTFSNELGMSGGSEKSNYYLNFEYTKQNGVFTNTDYDRKSMRFNFENRPNNSVKVGLNSTLSYNVQNYGIRQSASLTSATLSPLYPARLENGQTVFYFESGGRVANPVAEAEYNINRNTSFRGLTNIYTEVAFLKSFRFRSNLGIDFTLAEAKEKTDPRLPDHGNSAAIGIGRIEEQDLRRANLINTNTLNYVKTIKNEHNISALLGQEAQILSQKSLSIAVRNLSLPYYDQISSPGVEVFRNSGLYGKETLLSYFGQLNYDFQNKYYLLASVRRDGSSRFGDDKRYGTYWSTGLGWVLSNESFLKTPWLNYLKLRGSIGAAGNAQAINARTRYDVLENAVFLGTTAVYPNTIPGSPEVHWEKTFTWDGGLEARLFNNRLEITADIYKKYTSGLIYPVPLAPVTGYYEVLQNIGDMENTGVELSLSGKVINGNRFSWTINANWSTNQNKLVKSNGPDLAFVNGLGNKEGDNFNSFYMVKWAGVDPETGNALYYDINGNKTATYNGTRDRVLVGKPQPDGFGAVTNRFRYKDFDLSAMLYYQYGNQVYVADGLVNDGRSPLMNQSVRALNRWQKKGDIAENPKRLLNNSSGSRQSTRFLYDADYLRLQNITVGYRIPAKLIQRIKLNSARVFLQGNNLALWSKVPGDDLNNINIAGEIGFNYPNSRTFSIGLNANF